MDYKPVRIFSTGSLWNIYLHQLPSLGIQPTTACADNETVGRSHFQIKYNNFHIRISRVIIFPIIGDPMKFTKIITFFSFG